METESDVVATTKLRLRDDLRSAMKDRQTTLVEVLRSLLGAIDQAEAVPVVAERRGYVSRPFSDAATEVPRKRLSAEDVRTVIATELDELHAAAEECAKLDRADAAAEHLVKASIVERYLTLV